MPYPFPKARYQVKNWREYDQALQERGSLTVWVTPEALAAWHPLPTGKRGRARLYSDLAIETGHGVVATSNRKPPLRIWSRVSRGVSHSIQVEMISSKR